MSHGLATRAAWLERLWHELTQPACFDEGVEVARNACVAGASLAAAVISAGAYYDNPLSGVPALRACMKRLAVLPLELRAWQQALAPAPDPEAGRRLVHPRFWLRLTRAGRGLLFRAGWPRRT